MKHRFIISNTIADSSVMEKALELFVNFWSYGLFILK